jgi:uncharacterized coiled-coil protein SlyX
VSRAYQQSAEENMTIDERIEMLVASQEKTQISQDKTQIMLAGIVDSIQRLERIVLIHSLNIDDLEKRLDELESRRPKKPQ